MQSKVAPFAATPDPTYGRQASPASIDAQDSAEAAAPAEEADLRLVIEEDQTSGNYVYMTINRRTGEVVQRLPRDQVLRMRQDDGYVAGGVIRTRA